MNFTGERLIPNHADIELEIEHMLRYNFAKQFVENKVVLDSACGEGYGSDIISESAKEVYGIDISTEAITEAKKKYKKGNIRFIESNITDMPFSDDKFDIIVSYETIEHVDEASQLLFMKEVKRVLKSDGTLIISTPNKSVYSDKYNYHNEFHIKEFYKVEFIRFLKKFFRNVELCNQYFEVANVIEKKDCNKTNSIGLLNDDNVTKYYIAVCSDVEVELNYSSNIHVMDNNYLNNKINRIISLQNEVEERNKHIKKLDNNILNTSKEIERLNAHVEKLSNWGIELEKQSNELYEQIEKCNLTIESRDKLIKSDLIKIESLMVKASNKEMIIQEKDKQINVLQTELEKRTEQLEKRTKQLEKQTEELEKMHLEQNELNDIVNTQIENINFYQTELNNKNGHIELLLERDRELERIHNSTGWKFLLMIYKIEDTLFPVNSKRRFLARIFKRFIKNPKVYLRYLNVENIKKLFRYMKNEDTDRVNSRLESFEEKHTPQVKEELLILSEDINEYEKIEFPSESKPLVSIVIPVYNQWNYTYNCLKSIKENTVDISYEIIIADDVSSDETKNISKYISNINVIRNEKNLGFLLNCNNAAKTARGRYIHFLNNDTNVQKSWLSSLVELIESENNIGMVGSKLVFSNGKLQEAGGIIWNDASGWNYGRLDDPDKPEYNYVKEVDYISGASIMIKKSLWEEIGGFDERYAPAYFEDTDLAFEVRKHGFKVLYQPKSVVVHFEGISNGTDENNGIKSYQVKNKEKFLNKWKSELEKNHFNNAENVFLARDRSKDKKTILMIDHYVPHYDKDAGSRTIYQYLKLLTELGLNVKFMGDNFYKHEPYSTELEQMGIEILYGSFYANHWSDWIKENSSYLNYVFLNRPHVSIKYINHVKRYTNAKIVYYVVDLHYVREMREYKITGDKSLLKSSQDWKNIEIDIMSKSDVVFTLSTDEKNLINNEFGSEKSIISPIFYFNNINDKNIDINSKTGIIFVGGFVHKPNEDGVLWFVERVFPKIVEEIPDCIFTIIGSNPTTKIKELESKNIHVTGYVTDEELLKYYESSRVCVIPLRFGAGVKGKTIEAMYNKVAIVSTIIGIEGLEDIESYITSANEEADFANKVIELYNNDALNEQTINRYPQYVNKYFSHEGALNLFKRIFS
jgi:GT2 family glycosyltransferase/ubiquinone/menaquinone biosynthesis C-methylase UbiE